MAYAQDDDEWEYEYDENETEDFYIPIDVSNVPGAQGPVNALPKRGHPVLLKTRLRALNAGRRETENAADAQGAGSVGEIQITGLHTSNPLLLYNDQMLSCQWTSTLGTDMFFVKPKPAAGVTEKPLRSLPAVDLLATGSARLVARVGRLRPRDDLFENPREEQHTTDKMDTSADAPSERGVVTQPTGNMQPDAQEGRPAPSNFLARLNEAKAKRGDWSRLVLSQTPNGPRLVAEEDPTQSPSNGEAEDTDMGGTG
ncbi:hypothetical protein BU26DRAFT_568669 [Trematosphaeria pertusa]|uniref:Transcription factor TFIIIC triple barrel domain-containing protein n=1 Tax=Trematosphaeria pertusa TaxID=390896 RepID=A0A6A6I2F3_9PLEO|nr:uncharacterized protein BU26DRAFT_568669 [Trematosphaeria pertusa]KAF2244654.1 hypothetical protein BU26DRAFT_568669 [Trematosphaeria pertusa]